MNDKKLSAKRIILFVLFSYGLYWIFAGLCDLLGILQDDAGFQLVTYLAMFTPRHRFPADKACHQGGHGKFHAAA